MNKHFIKTLIFALVIYSLISCSISIRNFNNDENSLTLPLTVSATELQRIIESRSLAGVATNTDPLVTNTLVRLTPNYAINAIYATENDSGNYSGNSWANSIARNQFMQ